MQHSPLTAEHRAAGARDARPEAAGTPSDFGDAAAEYRAAREAAALFDATERGRLEARGPDAGAFLQRLLTVEVRRLEPGRVRPALLLSPKGRVAEVFDLAAFGGDVWAASTPPGREAALRAALDAYLFTENVELVESGEGYAPLELVGPGAAGVLESALGEPGPAGEGEGRLVAGPAGPPLWVRRLAVAGALGWRLEASPEAAPALWRALVGAGARPAGLAARAALRIEALRAGPGDVLPSPASPSGVYPQEARLEPAFALDKGCYVGQEVVAKLDTYGGLKRCLFAVRGEGAELLPSGEALLGSDAAPPAEAGRLASSAHSFLLDAPIALAYLKRSAAAPGTRLTLADSGRAVVVLDGPVRPDALGVTGGFP